MSPGRVSVKRPAALALTALALLLGGAHIVAIALDHPFSGDIAVSTEPYRQDALSGL